MVALTREALASTILPVPPETPTTSARTAHCSPLSPIGPELPMELRIPLPPSKTSSEDGRDDFGADDYLRSFGSIEAEESLHEGSSYILGQVSKDEGIDHDRKLGNAYVRDVSLDELAQLVELERYEGQQSISLQNNLHRLYLSTGLKRRLSRIASLTYRRMVGLYKAVDQAGFVGIHQAYENLSTECHAAKFVPQVGSWNHRGENLAARLWVAPTTSWIQQLPLTVSEDILRFLVNIRTNDGFLSGCISGMSYTELTALTSSYQPVALVGSVLQNHSHVKPRVDGYGSRGGNLIPGLDALRTFHKNDPYHLLLYGVFDDSAEPRSQEYRLRSDTWSTTCARVLMDGKRGSDEFAITTLDAFAGLQSWTQVPQLEAFLMETLSQGAFLLDPPQPTDFKQPVEIRNAQAVIAASHFFDKALKRLFQLLVDEPLEAAVPQSALDFAHATLRKIMDPRVRLKAKTFIVSKWYFQCLLSNILVYPESYGILLEHHVGETARRMILQELAHRMQKIVADVLSPWNHTTIVTPDIQAFVAQILGLFEPPSEAVAPDQRGNRTAPSKNLMLCLDDILCLMEFFYPELSSSLPTTTSDGSAPSTASSVAGSSTLMASSTTPSSSGTSIATHEFISGDPAPLQVKEREVSSPLEKGSSQNLLLEPRYGGHRLKDSYNKLKEKPNSEASSPAGHLSGIWAIIHISYDGTRLSTEPDLFDEVSPISTGQVAFTSNETDTRILTDALTRLVMDRVHFQTSAFRLGIDTTDSTGKRLILTSLLETMGAKCRANFDFTGALYWWRAGRILHELAAPEHLNVLDDLLQSISKDLQASINTHAAIMDRCSLLYHSLETLSTFQKMALQTLNDKTRVLRIKMWYVSDVRHSAAYEDALHVTRALRAMACSSRVKQPGSISTWARHRLRNSLGTDRSESQTLEILTAHKDHGGLSKLADEQVDLTWRWLTRNSIENFCKGEERIHRFCFEIQKCVNKLVGLSLIESPVLWSSRLFEREKSMLNPRPSRSATHEQLRRPTNEDSTAKGGERLIYSQGSQASWAPSVVPSSVLPNFDMSSLDEAWSYPRSSIAANFTDLGNYSRLKYSSGTTPIPYPLQTYQAAVAPRSGLVCNTLPEELVSAKMDFTQHIKKILGSLLTSDLGYLLWVHGTETDAWVNHHASYEMPSSISANNPEERKSAVNTDMSSLGNLPDTSELSSSSAYTRRESILENLPSKSSANSSSPFSSENLQPVPSSAEFPYKQVYKTLLDRFSNTLDSYNKLDILSQLHCLVMSSLDDQSSTQVKGGVTESQMKKAAAEPTPVSNRAIGVPRTKATSLEEVIANCNERRISTLRIRPTAESSVRNPHCSDTSPPIPTTDSIVLALRDVFRDPFLRPKTLFRDLQFIAAFVPSSILDHTSQGTAFWDTGLAALALKDELCASLVTRATEITTYHINGLASSLPTPPSLATTSLRDAAHLWLLAAKEGSPVAARELGLFYLTHPHLLPLVTFPFSRPRDVFRSTLTNERGGIGGNSGKGGGNFSSGAGGGALGTSTGGQPAGLDPWTFAMVFHWMEVAANGGDRDASEFLRGNGELSGVR